MNVLAVTRQREWSWWVRWVAAWLGLLEGLVAVLSFGFFDASWELAWWFWISSREHKGAWGVEQ